VGFGRKALFFGGALALGAAMSAADQAKAERARKARQLTGEQIAWLIIFAVLAILVAWGLVKAGAGPLVLLSPIAWFYALRGFRNANERRVRHPVVRQRSPKGAIEQVRPTASVPSPDNRAMPPLEIDGKQRDRMRRVEELGVQGAKLYERAESAVRQTLSTEAVRSGWLGDLQENDFGADFEMIAANSRAALELRQLINELSSIPNPNGEDRRIVGDARLKVSQLDRQSRDRVVLLEKCWERAKLIDVSIRDEREQAAMAEKRDDIHSRVAAALYGADTTPDQPSSAADRGLGFEAAYREIKGLEKLEPNAEEQARGRDSEAAISPPSRPRVVQRLRNRMAR